MAPFTDHDGALLTAAQYAGDSSKFDYWVDSLNPSWHTVAWAAKIIGDHVAFVLEGSRNDYDWANDARFLPETFEGALLHRGFWANMQATWVAMRSWMYMRNFALPPRLMFFGHSKGAANADDLAWLAMLDGYQVDALIRWGEPAPSYNAVLGDALAKIPQSRSYWNVKPDPRWPDESDPIGEVPLKIFGAKWPTQRIHVYAPPTTDGILKYHHFGTVASGGGYLSVTPDTVILA